MTHMYFSARAEGRISYGHLGRTDSCFVKDVSSFKIVMYIPIRQEATLAATITRRHAPTARQGGRLRNEVCSWTGSCRLCRQVTIAPHFSQHARFGCNRLEPRISASGPDRGRENEPSVGTLPFRPCRPMRFRYLPNSVFFIRHSSVGVISPSFVYRLIH